MVHTYHKNSQLAITELIIIRDVYLYVCMMGNCDKIDIDNDKPFTQQK